MSNEFDIIMETQAGNYILLASSSNRQYASIVAKALYEQYKDNIKPGVSQARAVVVRDMGEPREPRLMDVWPERRKDASGWQDAVERYRKQFG